MLNLTYEYKLIPTNAQRETFDHWLEICLSERAHKCPECGYQTNRDVAAAQVVLQRGYTAMGDIAVNFGESK